MNRHRRKARLLAALLLLCYLTASVCHAEDTVDSLTQNAGQLETELEGLNGQARQLAIELNNTLSEIEETTAQLAKAKEALAEAKGEEQLQYESMKQRVKYMYENNPAGLLEVLFSARSMAEFLNRMTFMTAISEYDANALEELVKTRETIAEEEAELTNRQNQLLELQEQLKEKESMLYGQISMASDKLQSYQQRIADARARAEAAKEAEVKPQIPKKEPEPADEPETPGTSQEQGSTPAPGSSQEPIVNTSVNDVELLAALIECEAGSSDYEGMLAVGAVVVNRMKSSYYPDTLRGVVYQSGQFPPATNGLVDRVLRRGIKNSCKQAAEDALAGKNNVGDCLSFRASSSGHAGTIIGSNVFF